MSHMPGGYEPPPPGFGPPPPPGYGPPLPPGGLPPGYGPPPPGYGPGPQGQPGGRPAGTVSAAILLALSLLCCNALSLISLVLAILGLTLAQSSPQSARTCTAIGWVFWGLGALFFAGFIALGILGELS